MTHDDAHAEHGLDRWLAAAMVSLDRALDDVLNLDAGLVDAKLLNLRHNLTRDLDQVLDLDAGLDDILPAKRPPSPAAEPPARQPTGDPARTPLGAFADDFTALPAHKRLAARAWLPIQVLIELHDAVRVALRANDLIQSLARDLNRARDITPALDPARDLDPDRALTRALTRALDRARDLTLGLDRDLDLARALARDLNPDPSRALALTHSLDRALTLARTLARALARALTLERDLARDLARDLTGALARDLTSALAGALALARGLDRVRGPDPVRTLDRTSSIAVAFHRALRREVEAIGDRNHAHDVGLEEDLGRLIEAATNVSGADLRQLDLRGIPLQGLRWSDATQWPVEWRDRIRRDSIELHPGHYEIRQGGIDIDHRVDAPV